MANFNHRYPQNVPGRFYVDDQCLDHDLCAHLCPKNFKRNDAGGHYFVYQQPETPEEIALCLQAVEACPVEAIGCDGDQPHPPEHHLAKPWWRFW
ncbi:ferredoxin [Prosthecobacter sp.]|uniref:ferredoxin n=1 Tax=Prosthecobacter sp. TaxID=1965333 RepID=UPI001D89C895|nr:ferredoxin [Prosthecobacter sp.]MCB1276061.1 ferredoxin [Prosthecobacter sp.]